MLKLLCENTWGVIRDNKIVVQARYWFYPHVPEQHSLYKTGIIGEFECVSSAKYSESALLFSKLEEVLKEKGATKIIGPMNGNTWQNYRLTTFYGNKPAFTLEPYTPEYFIRHWLHSGFIPHETYSSYLSRVNTWQDKRVERLHDKFSHLIFRKIEEEDLSPIFDLSLSSFAKNPYYIPIDKETYLEKYGKMLLLLQPNLSWVVYDKEKLVGYVFAVMNQQSVDKVNDSVILKTAAIDEGRQYAGLGVYLLSKLMSEVKEKEIDYVIHALMYDKNPVQNIIKTYSEKMRGYTLYKKDIV